MTAEPTWFGDDERPLHGWVHTPGDGAIRGGVVLCPPIGIDLSYADNNLRLLARALEGAGFLVVRFDYDGTGQSAGGMSDPGRLDAWLESVRAAVGLARGAGSTWTGLVGLRLGATLAAQVVSASTETFESLVLWDPYISGTGFLREQSAVKLGVLPQLSEKVQGLTAPGYVFSPEAVSELQDLEMPAASTLRVGKVLVLKDPTRRVDRRLAERLAGPHVEWQEYCEKSDLFDTGRLDYRAPRALLEQITTWIDAACASQVRTITRPSPRRMSAVVASYEDGSDVIEEHVRLGPIGLFGIACRKDESDLDEDAATNPTVLFLTIAAESSIGPARQWVDFARELASAGIRSVRFDFSSVGESPTRPGQEERALYSERALDDIDDAARTVSFEDPGNVLLVGVCSGAYAALSAAHRVRPRGIVAINPIMTEWGLEPSGEASSEEGVTAEQLPHSLAASIRARFQGSTMKAAVAARLPPSLWRVVFALGLARSPAQLLTPVWREHVPTLLVCGEEEARAPKTRTPKALRRLAEDGISRFEELPTLNHSLLHATNRETVFRMVRDFYGAVVDATSQSTPLRAGPEVAVVAKQSSPKG